MARDPVMDPAASPARPGVRRMNNVPVAILGGAFAVFLGILAYVAAGRAAEREASEDPKAVRSALSLAERVAGDHEAGMVPAAASDASGGAGAAEGSRTGFSPGSTGRPSDFPAPPLPPRLRDGGVDDEVLLPPSSMQLQAYNATSDGYASASYRNVAAVDDEARDLQRMRAEMFKQALRAKTAAMVDSTDASSPARPVDRVTQVRAQLAASRALGAGEDYVQKLRQLQEAGLLPDDHEPDDGRTEARGDAYAQFAGDPEQNRWALGSEQQVPGSPYELRAGAVIPATLQTGINSELPGQITALVAQDVRDTATGKYVLIPQASRLVGTYGSDVQFGQQRVLVAWQRIVWPDGKALDIGAMPGSDGAGYAGFKDLVDTHFWRLFGSALLLSGITGGIAYSQDSQAAQDGRTTVSGAMSQALGQQLGQLSEEMIRKQMNVAPTIEIRPGYRFNVQVTKDLTFNAPYRAFDYQRSISAGSQTFRLGRSVAR